MIIDYSVPLSIIVAIPGHVAGGLRDGARTDQALLQTPHADQILVTFGLAIILQEIARHYFGANPIPQAAPAAVAGSANIGALFGLGDNIVYPWWRLIYLAFSLSIIGAVFAFLQFTTFGMVVRAGMQDRETVGLLGINIERRFTIVFGIAAVVAGLAGVMYTPILPPDYHMGDGFPRAVVRGRGRRWYGIARRGGARRLSARHPAVVRLDERGEEHSFRVSIRSSSTSSPWWFCWSGHVACSVAKA